MRATGCLCVLLGALAALPVAGAQAKIKPLPKPVTITPTPAAASRGSLIAPVSKPVVHSTVKAARPQATPAARTTVRRTTSAAQRHAIAPAVSQGGREQPHLVRSASGGRAAPALPAVAVLVPTPLGVVGADEPLPVLRDAWPPWMLALITLLAFAEAAVLALLVRSSPAWARRA
jgi:hypothetical protein